MKNFIPYFTGSPPALVMAYSMFNAVVSSTSHTALWGVLAFFAALAGVGGMIATEVYIYRNAARAFADKEYETMSLMALGGAIITAMIIYTVYTGQDVRALVATSIAALVCNVALGGEAYMEEKNKNKDKSLTVETVLTDNKVAIMDAETQAKKVELAIEKERTKQAKAQASAGQPALSGLSGRATGQKKLNPETLQKVKDYMQIHPGDVRVRDLEKAGIIGHSQAAEYIKAVSRG